MDVHEGLKLLISPVTPGSIQASSFQRNSALKIILWVTISSLVLFFVSILLQPAHPQIMAFLGLLGAAGLGASFYALYTASTYFRKGTFDPQHNQIYLVRLGLGICAGVILGLFADGDLLNLGAEKSGVTNRPNSFSAGWWLFIGGR